MSDLGTQHPAEVSEYSRKRAIWCQFDWYWTTSVMWVFLFNRMSEMADVVVMYRWDVYTARTLPDAPVGLRPAKLRDALKGIQVVAGVANVEFPLVEMKSNSGWLRANGTTNSPTICSEGGLTASYSCLKVDVLVVHSGFASHVTSSIVHLRLVNRHYYRPKPRQLRAVVHNSSSVCSLSPDSVWAYGQVQRFEVDHGMLLYKPVLDLILTGDHPPTSSATPGFALHPCASLAVLSILVQVSLPSRLSQW